MIPRILEKVYHEPWLITVAGFASIHQLVENKLLNEDISQRLVGFDAPEPVPQYHIDADQVATIPVTGVLGHRVSSLEKMCGATDYLDIQRATEESLSRGAKGVLYAFDSSGGMVRGCSELANYIRDLSVPTAAWTDSRCSSAAYWLASACNSITATETSELGSIGVFLPWIDRSKVWETEGIRYEPFTNEGADLKGAGAGPSLSAEQREYLQKSVNYIGEQFHEFVSSNRKVKPTVFRAGAYFGKQAVDVGLVDVIGTLADARSSLLTRCQEQSVSVNHRQRQVAKMTREELQAQHPELWAQMVQESQSAVASAAREAADLAITAERTRLSELDALNFSSACGAIVIAAKAGGKTAKDIAPDICKILAEDNRSLRQQVGVYKGAHPTSKVASIDANAVEGVDGERQLADRLVANVVKRYGLKAAGATAKATGGKN